MFEPLSKTPVAHGLKMGRPDNRRYTYKGNKMDTVRYPHLMGPDAHGVSWIAVRGYYDKDSDTTLVVFAPVHPDKIAEVLRDSA